MSPTDRGQSEVVGLVLLVALVVIVTTVFGVALFGTIDDDSPPQVTIEGSVNNTTVRLVNAGGESLDREALVAILRGDAGERRVPLGTAGSMTGTDGRFDPGDAWTWDHPYGECTLLDVYLVHNGSNSLVYRATKRVGDDEACLA